jgi:hypothetical protein
MKIANEAKKMEHPSFSLECSQLNLLRLQKIGENKALGQL